MLLLARRGRSIYLELAATRTGLAWTLPRAGTRAAAAELGFELRAGDPLTSFRHRTYSEDLRIDVCAATARRGTRRAKGRWFDPEALDRLPLRAPTLKAVKRLRLRDP